MIFKDETNFKALRNTYRKSSLVFVLYWPLVWVELCRLIDRCCRKVHASHTALKSPETVSRNHRTLLCAPVILSKVCLSSSEHQMHRPRKNDGPPESKQRREWHSVACYSQLVWWRSWYHGCGGLMLTLVDTPWSQMKPLTKTGIPGSRNYCSTFGVTHP